jgi:Josephin
MESRHLRLFIAYGEMQIAHALDAAERGFMGEGGVDSEDFRKYAAEESNNVTVNGMFSIQVRWLHGARSCQDRCFWHL